MVQVGLGNTGSECVVGGGVIGVVVTWQHL